MGSSFAQGIAEVVLFLALSVFSILTIPSDAGFVATPTRILVTSQPWAGPRHTLIASPWNIPTVFHHSPSKIFAIHSNQENRNQAKPAAIAVPVSNPSQFETISADNNVATEPPQASPITSSVSENVIQYPNYGFKYAVKDEKTGDEKSHEEVRYGDNVVGKYTVVDPDGTLRIVSYTAGKDGFKAVVSRNPNYASPNSPPTPSLPVVPALVGRPAQAFAVPIVTTFHPRPFILPRK